MTPPAEQLRTALTVVRNFATAGSALALARAARSPRQAVMYVQECLFQYESMFGRREFSRVHVSAEVGGGEPIDVILAAASVPGANSWYTASGSYLVDLISLCELCRLTKPRVVFEIGTLLGFTAYHMALNTPADTHIYTLDLPPEAAAASLRTTIVDDWHIQVARHAGAVCFTDRPESARIQRLFGDSARFDYGPFLDGVDLFFIDGAHSYEYVKSDSEYAFRCCRKGGVIAWHDAGRVGVNGVTRYLRELTRDHRICLVPGGSLAFMVKQ